MCSDNTENSNPNAAEASSQEQDEHLSIIAQLQAKHRPKLDFLLAVDSVVPELVQLLSHDQDSDVSGAVGAHCVMLCVSHNSFGW
jgi:hypothetical protein